MRSRLALALAWLAACALAAPGAPVAEESPAPGEASSEQSAVEAAPPAHPAVDPAPQSPPAPESSEAAQTPEPAAPPPAPTPPATDPAPDRPVAFAATPGSVTIQDFSFGPATVTVDVGESVTWRNSGPSTHSATSSDGGFDTGLLARGESGSATFDEAGTFSYICTPHPSMKGTVRVVAQTSGDGGSVDDGSSSGVGDNGESTGATGPVPSGGELADTGAEPLWFAVTGIGLLLIGGSGIRHGRRGRP